MIIIFNIYKNRIPSESLITPSAEDNRSHVNISYPLSCSNMDLALPSNFELDKSSYIGCNKKVLVTSSTNIGQTSSSS